MTFLAATRRLSAGIVVWALHFTIAYGYTGLACARGLASTVPWVVGGATVLAVLACLVLVVLGYRDRARFESWMMATIAALSLVAIVWEAIPVWIVPTCG